MATVALDLDGPCYEFHRTVRYMLNHYRGTNLPRWEEVFTEWWPNPEYISKDDWHWVWDKGIKKGLFRYGHMVKDTRVALEALVDLGYDLCIVTHRPEQAVRDTEDWVDLFFKDIPLIGEFYFTQGESKTLVEADILIDDKLENVEDWSEVGRTAILWDAPYNRSAEYLHGPGTVLRAKGWAEVVELLSLGKDTQ